MALVSWKPYRFLLGNIGPAPIVGKTAAGALSGSCASHAFNSDARMNASRLP
jgi:hypothetical protein